MLLYYKKYNAISNFNSFFIKMFLHFFTHRILAKTKNQIQLFFFANTAGITDDQRYFFRLFIWISRKKK